MKISTLMLIGLALLALADGRATVRHEPAERKGDAATVAGAVLTADAEFIGLSPSEQKFVMQPGQLLVILAAGQCKPSDSFGGSVDVLRPPTPDFVKQIPLCRASDFVIGALSIQPANKDLGSYTVRVNTHGCDHTTQEFSFQV